MGLRAASVRHPNAVVMAPALTEAGQSQNFTLPPSSPINNITQNGEAEAKNELKQIKCSYPYFSPSSKDKVSDLRTFQAASDISHQLNIIMSTCPPSTGDQQDTMGLQKAGTDPITTLLKDKTMPNDDMDQLFNNLTSDIGSAGDINITPQNVEDLMQAFKIEAGGGDRETIFPELFGEVDMMNMCEEESKETRAKEMLEELNKKQLKLERRSEFLLRRIRKVQARLMGHHVSGEVAGLYEHIHRTLRYVQEPHHALSPMKAIGSRSVNSLVRKLHMSAIQQSTRQKHAAKYFGSGSGEAVVTVRSPAGALCVPRMEPEVKDELERVAGTLHTQLGVVEQQVDSDATASSSGAESCDEMQSFSNPHQHYLSIGKRAAWRYANERAAVAARWTWLQAQISDLEYRIRQHNELHRQIRSCKGSVALGESVTSTSTSTTNSPTAVNGYRGQLPGSTPCKEEPLANGAVGSSSGGTHYLSGSARTRPLNRGSFRKRKLLQTTGLHTVSKKASRPSNIRCGCVPPIVPCALCTGRTDPTFPRDSPDQLTVPERVALLDPGYHPVLSFPDDISQSIHLEAIMKLSDWQQKSLRCNLSKSLKSLAKGSDRLDKIGGLDHRIKKSEHRRKYSRLIKSELKNKLSRGRRLSRGTSVGSSGSGIVRLHRKRRTASLAMAQLHALASESTDELEALEAGTLISHKRHDSGESLTPSPLSHVAVMPYRRNRVDSYDIDNIVIPYSVAASTRVEKLQYKEILTPKWRIIDNDFPAKYDVKNNGIVRRVSEDSDIEDISEETVTSRHDRCEHDEKKKFLSYIKFPLSGGRSRANRRTDSRAESSGANTPDPMSPASHLLIEGEPSVPTSSCSPITSPPATPTAHLEETPQHHHLRRRTVSSQRCPTPPIDLVEVAPYESRVFPLPEAEFERMMKVMPEGHAQMPKPRESDKEDSLSPSRAGTPLESDSTESALAEEDPNDPEWECRRS